MRVITREQATRRYEEEGRGRGEGVGYQSWLQAHDVPSKGVTYRMNGRKHRREHVLFSTIERNAFLAAQWLDSVVEIREQFALWPLEETEVIARDLEVNHPSNPKGGVVVMTTDLLLTNADDSKTALAVKPEEMLNQTRVLEKLEIERLYWEQRGVSWGIVTERDLPEDLVWNLGWIDAWFEITPETLDPEQICRIEAHLFGQLNTSADRALNLICLDADDRFGVEEGRCLGVFRHALARKRWVLPLDRKIDPSEPLRTSPVLAEASHNRSTLAA